MTIQMDVAQAREALRELIDERFSPDRESPHAIREDWALVDAKIDALILAVQPSAALSQPSRQLENDHGAGLIHQPIPDVVGTEPRLIGVIPPSQDLTLIFERDEVREAFAGHCCRTHVDDDDVRDCSYCTALRVALATAIMEWKAICDTEPR